MITILLQRSLGLLFVLLGVSFIVSVSLRAIPGDPAIMIAGLEARPEELQLIREQLGLDKPVLVQFMNWLWGVIRGDFGNSLLTGRPVFPLLVERFWHTFQLAVIASILAIIIGVLVGVFTAWRRYSILDNVVMVLSLIGVSMPGFWLGIMLILIFAVNLRWLPAGSAGTWKHLVLPTISLAAFSLGIIARMTRGSMLEVLEQDFVRTARSKGLTETRVVLRHALANALLPVITVIGLQFGYLLAGAVITETVFNWPGIGRLIVVSIFRRDYTVVQGAVLVVATCFVLVNFAVDLMYLVVDPRIRN